MNAIFTGEPLPASEALHWGLVNQVVPHDQVITGAIALAEKICDNAPMAIRACKQIVYRGLDATVDFPGTAWEINNKFAEDSSASEDALEGVRAFTEKRKPKWKGR